MAIASNGDTTVVDDSRKNGHPMELYIGKKFKFELWEEWVKEMRINEISVIELDWKHCQVYPLISKQYRNYCDTKSGHHHHDDANDETKFKRSHHCCGMASKAGYGYEDLDKLGETPPERLQFTIEVIEVEHPDQVNKEIWLMNDEEKMDTLPLLKAEGNRYYGEKNFEKASYAYRKALTLIDQLMTREKPDCEEWHEIDRLKIPFLSNLAACEFSLEQYYDVIKHTDEVLAKDPDNVKALFRRAKAHAAVWDCAQARLDFQRVATLDPGLATTVKQLLAELDAKAKNQSKEESQRFRNKLFKS